MALLTDLGLISGATGASAAGSDSEAAAAAAQSTQRDKPGIK